MVAFCFLAEPSENWGKKDEAQTQKAEKNHHWPGKTNFGKSKNERTVISNLLQRDSHPESWPRLAYRTPMWPKQKLNCAKVEIVEIFDVSFGFRKRNFESANMLNGRDLRLSRAFDFIHKFSASTLYDLKESFSLPECFAEMIRKYPAGFWLDDFN